LFSVRCGALAVVAAVVGLAASVPGVAAAAPYEPNDSFNQAYGPLVGGQVYEAAKETSNDQDWYYLNTSGQRQIDVAVSGLTGCGGGGYIELYDINGQAFISGGNFDNGTTGHLTYTTPARVQYAVRVRADQPCSYRLQVTPADALTNDSPGLTAEIRTPDGDALQRVYLDGTLVGETHGNGGQSFVLGHPGPASQITFEVQNTSGDWGWDASITDVEGRGQTTVWSEKQSGYASGRIGVVRRIVLTPSGGIISSCGELIAPVTCFPRDSDGDGIDDSTDQCRDSDGVAPTGCPDADRDGIPDASDKCVSAAGPGPAGCPVKQRFSTAVTIKRHGARYGGRVVSPSPGCVSGRRVVLRRVGGGTRSYGSAVTSSTGTFTIRRSRRLRGRVYLAVAGMATGTLICDKTASKLMRG
jgi:hypothetical protein